MSPNPKETAVLLKAISEGNEGARKDLFTLLYTELHALAHSALRKEPPDPVLQTTALIHEAYVRLVPQKQVHWQDRGHFFAVAANAMRRILISDARRRRAAKRGGGMRPLSLDGAAEPQEPPPAASQMSFEDLESLDEALERLKSLEGFQRMCTIVELLFFAGMTQEETAEVLGISKRTVRRDWDFARVWLQREIRKDENREG